MSARAQRISELYVGGRCRIAREHVPCSRQRNQRVCVGLEKETLLDRTIRSLRHDANVAGMGTISFLERQPRVTVRLAVRLCIPEGPIASAIARPSEYLANASRAITCIGPIPSSGGQIPTHVSTHRRLAQHRWQAIDHLVAVRIDLSCVDRKNLLYNGRLDGWYP